MPQHLLDCSTGWKGVWRLAGTLCLLCLAGLLFAQQPEVKQSVPPKSQLDKSQALIDDIFKEDFDKAKTPEAKTKLAELLFQQGKESTDSQANRYLLYWHTQKLAAEAGNLSLAMNAIAELDRQFKIDALNMKATALTTALPAVQSPEASTELANAALELIKLAVEDDNYTIAKELSKVAGDAARKAKSIKLVTAIDKRLDEVDQLQKNYAKLKPFLDKLKAEPADAEANLEMGKYYGLLKGKWDKAMPFLAKGTDAELKALALKDLANPKETDGQVEVADSWWDLAKKHKDLTKKNMQLRAAHWYTKALDKLTGLNRTKALKRIEEVSADAQVPVFGVALGPAGKVGELRRLTGHGQEIKSVAFSPDGQYGLSGAIDNKMILWDLKDGKQAQVFTGHTKQVWGVAFHSNGQHVASASWDANAKLWDAKTGKEVRTYGHPIDINGIAFSPDGKQMLVGCDNKFMRLWDVDSGQKIRDYLGATNYVYGVAFSPNGQLVACGSLDQSARVYDKNSGQLVKEFAQHKNAVHMVAFSPDSKFLFTCGDEAVHIWDIATGAETKRFSVPSGSVRAMALSKDGRRLVTGSDDNAVRFWDVNTGNLIQAFPGHTDQVGAIALTGDARYALSGDYSGVLILWAMPTK